jgi:hypothetical protein
MAQVEEHLLHKHEALSSNQVKQKRKEKEILNFPHFGLHSFDSF